jgi:predicted SnoaL-like aldol condensation-catalyzing enzyme
MSSTEETRRLAHEFIEMAFGSDMAGAVERYVSPDKYIQHHHASKDGREWNIAKIREGMGALPDARCEVKRIIADGDIFMAYVHFTTHPGDVGYAMAEMFRVEDGKIVEHWDVIEKIPDVTVSEHPFF